jgi:hypothetical protein
MVKSTKYGASHYRIEPDDIDLGDLVLIKKN